MLADRELVQEAAVAGVDDEDLLLDRQGRELALLEDLGQPHAAVELGLADLVELGPELGEGQRARGTAAGRRRSLPAICFMALIWAWPPTRETEMPTLMAGRTPALNSSGSR